MGKVTDRVKRQQRVITKVQKMNKALRQDKHIKKSIKRWGILERLDPKPKEFQQEKMWMCLYICVWGSDWGMIAHMNWEQGRHKNKLTGEEMGKE